MSACQQIRGAVVIGIAFVLAACSTTINTSQAVPDSARANLIVKQATVSADQGVAVPADVPSRLEQAVMKVAASHGSGTMPTNLRITITKYDVVSGGTRFFAGAFAGSNKLYTAVDVLDSGTGQTIGRYEVKREANPGGYGVFYDQAQATIEAAADGIVEGLYGASSSAQLQR